jgi:hypothetical protein
MKSAMLLRNQVISPDARGARQRNEASTPSARSGCSAGLPSSSAKLP